MSYQDYFRGSVSTHSIGLLSGVIWGIGMLFNMIASGKAGFAISYGLGQGATMISALWGVFVRREFSKAPKGTNRLLTWMFICYVTCLNHRGSGYIMNKKVMIIGSSDTDMVMQLDTLPTSGKTLLGDNFQVYSGGKGANQAVAAARLGVEVIFVAAVGADQFGQQVVQNFKQDQIDVSCIKICPNHPSGVALIMVGDNGENMIGIASGASFQLLPEDIPTEKMSHMDCVLLQLETPIDTVMHAARHAKKNKGLQWY